MKKIGLALLFGAALVSGCATVNNQYGTPIAQEKVQQIKRGETTTAELLSIMGPPQTKAVISATQEKWIYTHTKISAEAQSLIFTTNVQSSSFQQMLDVLIENDVVVNYTFSESQI